MRSLRHPGGSTLAGPYRWLPLATSRCCTTTSVRTQTFIVCPNQDVVYGGGFAALEKEPMVFQVPDFGKRFWVYPIYDHRTSEIGKIGQQYGTKPGFYMIVGPNWKVRSQRASLP